MQWGSLTEFSVSRQIIFMLSETPQVPSAIVQSPASPVKKQQSKFMNITYLLLVSL